MASTPAQERPHDPVLTGQWRVVPERSALAFETRIMLGLVPVRGRYAGYEGTLTVGADGDATGTLTIESATVSTGIKRRDRHLASTEFFAVQRFPQLRFELASLVAGEPGTARLTGTPDDPRPRPGDRWAGEDDAGGRRRPAHRRRPGGRPPRGGVLSSSACPGRFTPRCR